MADQNEEREDRDAPDPATAVAALAAKYGSAERAAERLYDTNERLLRKIDRLEQRPELPDGGRVIDRATAEALDAYQAIGVPDELKGRAERVSELEAEIQTRDRREQQGAAAHALGLDRRDLAAFAGADSLDYDLREEEVEQQDGKRVKLPVPYVTDADGKAHTLRDFGRAQWGRPFEALLVAPTGALPVVKGAVAPLMSAELTGKATEGSSVDALIRATMERANAPNALRPANA